MRIAGERSDGAKLVHIGGGLAIVLRGAQKSRPLDLDRTDRLGPWSEADNSLPARRVMEKAIASARVDLALDQPVHLGDTPGHPFRGNQYGEGEGRASMNPGGKNQHGGPYHGSPGAVAAGKATHEALRHAVGPVAAIEQARKDADAAQSGTATEEQHARLAKFHEGQAHVIATQPHAPMDATARHTRAADAHQAFASKPGAPEFKGHPDELDEAAADAAGRYWASPEGQAIKAQGGHSYKPNPADTPAVGTRGSVYDRKTQRTQGQAIRAAKRREKGAPWR